MICSFFYFFLVSTCPQNLVHCVPVVILISVFLLVLFELHLHEQHRALCLGARPSSSSFCLSVGGVRTETVSAHSCAAQCFLCALKNLKLCGDESQKPCLLSSGKFQLSFYALTASLTVFLYVCVLFPHPV